MGRKLDLWFQDVLQIEKIEGRRSDDDLFEIQQQRLTQIAAEREQGILPVDGSRTASFSPSARALACSLVTGFILKFPPTKN